MDLQDIDEPFPLPNLDDFDLSELSCDETASSSASSPLGSPVYLDDMALDSPVSSSSNESATSCTSPTLSRQDSDDSSTSSRGSKHRAKCKAPHCIKKEHVSILRRNERERNRVKLVSDGFANLRKHIPTMPVNKKLSKVDTLKTAIEYIRHLQRILNESNRIERERRVLHNLGLLQKAYKLQVQRSQVNISQQDHITALLMELPEIAPHPHPVPSLQQVNGLSTPNHMGMVGYYNPMELN